MHEISRRSLLRYSGIAATVAAINEPSRSLLQAQPGQDVFLANLNENAFGPSPSVTPAIVHEFTQLSRYATAAAAQKFVEQVAAYERVDPAQVIPGEILGELGLYLGSKGGPGGEFIYSIPGYLALVDAASHVGGTGIAVPLNPRFENDLPMIRSKVNARTRAIYLINPHNPTGTANAPEEFLRFLRDVSAHTTVVVDEAYLEFTPDFETRSAVSLVREGANVLVFRTFDKIHGLAGLPIGYTLAPKELADELREQGVGDAEGLGRLNIAAASAALADRKHVRTVRDVISAERAKWMQVLKELRLPHTESLANFVFFDAGIPHDEMQSHFREHGIEVARAFPPYATWVRITIGKPVENQRAQQVLRGILSR